MSGFNIDQQLLARYSRLRIWTMATAVCMFGVIANTYLVLTFAGSASFGGKLALAALIIAVTVYAILNTKTAAGELKALQQDRVAELEGTKYQENHDQIPVGQYLPLAMILFGGIAAAQFLALFGG